MCERTLCMFKHSKQVDEHRHGESAGIIDAVETISISVVDEEELVDDEEIDELNVNETTFINTSQTDNKFSEHTFKCDKCDFKAARKCDLDNHKEEKHNWCSLCYSSYKTQEILKDHIISKHK